MELTPEFTLAIDEFKCLNDLLGEDHPAARQAFLLAMQLAPDEFIEMASEIAVELDMMPDATGYLADGTSLFSLVDIAAKLGVTFEEAEQAMHEMLSMQAEADLPISNFEVDSTLIHRKQ